MCKEKQMAKKKKYIRAGDPIQLPPKGWMSNISGRSDGITSFTEEFESHPGRIMFKKYIKAWSELDDVEQALNKIACTDVYKNYADAMKYGVQIYNRRGNPSEF